MTQIPIEFRGYAGEPQSELDIAFLLGLLYDYLPFSIVVTSINDAFPDCEGVDPENGRPVRIELEVLSRNYLRHGHPFKGCDYIVCWRDNWPDSPIPVISIERIIEENGLARERFMFIPKPGSLMEQLYELKQKDLSTFETVNYFLDKALPRITTKHPSIRVDDTLKKHFNVLVKDSGVLGFYPHGKIVCLSVNECVKRFGEQARAPAKAFRDSVIGTKVMTNKADADAIADSLNAFLNALAEISN